MCACECYVLLLKIALSCGKKPFTEAAMISLIIAGDRRCAGHWPRSASRLQPH